MGLWLFCTLCKMAIEGFYAVHEVIIQRLRAFGVLGSEGSRVDPFGVFCILNQSMHEGVFRFWMYL